MFEVKRFASNSNDHYRGETAKFRHGATDANH
jgi:hypothetical protein